MAWPRPTTSHLSGIRVEGSSSSSSSSSPSSSVAPLTSPRPKTQRQEEADGGGGERSSNLLVDMEAILRLGVQTESKGSGRRRDVMERSGGQAWDRRAYRREGWEGEEIGET